MFFLLVYLRLQPSLRTCKVKTWFKLMNWSKLGGLATRKLHSGLSWAKFKSILQISPSQMRTIDAPLFLAS